MLRPSDTLLTGKVAIVTGGGEGIGNGISTTFAAFGAKVVVAEIDPQRANSTVAEIKAHGGEAIAAIVDVRNEADVEKMADLAFRTYGHVDILVNNVGDSFFLRKEFLQNTLAEWDALYQINLRHVFLCTRAIAPKMIERGKGGSIINISTVEAFRGIPGGAVYSAFKGALTSFSKSLALELGWHHIRVNAIAPDKTQTEMTRYDKRFPPEVRHMIPVWIPIGKIAMPDDIAGVALFLASDLSAFVTGTTVHADGGTLAAGGWYRKEDGNWTNTPARI
jgi:NAD(P)-dependent dehydrogenase (short-subunit alcohol dehydrogenase family)